MITVEFVHSNVLPITGWENNNKNWEMSQEDLESQATGDQEGEEEGRRVLVSSVAEISLTEAHVYLQLSSAPSGHIFTIYQVTRSQGLYCLLRKEEEVEY